MSKAQEIPSVLAFEKKMAPSDGVFYACDWEKRQEEAVPLRLKEKSVRGTISNRLKAALQKDPAKLDAEIQKPNLQTVDVCMLPMDCDTLQVRFSVKVLSRVDEPSACNVDTFQVCYAKAVREYIEEFGFLEIGLRFATNIANGRFLWRNRVGAEMVQISVKTSAGPETFIFDAISVGLAEVKSSVAESLGRQIADALAGVREYLLIDIVANVKVGAGQEVFPSQELITGDAEKSKHLYEVDGIAAMHSQKLGNALRTFDNWYEEGATAPIAVEVYGSVTSRGKAYRPPKDKKDFYTLFDKFACGESIPADQQHYVMAMLVRGGVFGQSSS